MNKPDPLDWFPCEPGPLLGALAGMRSPKGYVYIIVLLRIYENGGSCPDTLDAISTRTRLNKRVVTEALDELFREGRLYRGEGGIRNGKADGVLVKSYALREKRINAGAGGGKRAAEKRKQNQKNDPSSATPPLQRSNTQEQLQDSLFTDVKRAPEPDPKIGMKDPPLDPEADYYRRGREVLGPSAGGVLTKLLRAKGLNVSLARAAIEQASTRGDPKQYVGAMIRNSGAQDDGASKRTDGFANLRHRLRTARAAGDGPSAATDAGFFQPGGGPADSERAMGAEGNRKAALPTPQADGDRTRRH
jgi:hypothetical protein